MPRSNKKPIQTVVTKKIPRTIVKELIEYVVSHPPDFHGMERPYTFVQDMVWIALYKDVSGDGYSLIEEKIEFGYHIGHNALRKNVKEIRKCLHQWANEELTLGNLADWKHAAKYVTFPNPIGKVHLWIDSSDFRLEGKSSAHKSDNEWSFKEISPAQRYMAVVDAKGRPVKIWGGYSPKVYDGDFLKINQDFIEEKFNGATIIADYHFEKGKELFHNVNFLVNYSKPEVNQPHGPDEAQLPTNLAKKRTQLLRFINLQEHVLKVYLVV